MKYFLLKTMPPLLVTAWLFYDMHPISLGLLLYLPFAFRFHKRAEKKKKIWIRTLAFRDGILFFQHSLAAGYAPERSVTEAEHGLCGLYGNEHEMVKEFRLMSGQLSLGKTMESVFEELANRTEVDEIGYFSELLTAVKRTGGNFKQMVRDTARMIQDKIEIQRERNAAMASRKLESGVMKLMPFGMLLYLRLCSPNMVSGLYRNTFGILFMSALLLLWVAVNRFTDRIITGER